MRKVLLGHSTNDSIRIKSTSGGIGTSLVKYLFDQDKIDYAVSFSFNENTLKYEPKLISKFAEYNNCGSIYQELDYVKYIKDNIDEIRDKRLVLFCLPCQALLLRKTAEQNNIKLILLGLTCSSQQSHDATFFLLKMVKVDKSDVQFIKYRGDGWPGGIKIVKKNGSEINIPNNNSIWSQIFHSRLFIQKRCFHCNNTLNSNSDIVLADPWNVEETKSEYKGNTLFCGYTQTGEYLIQEAKLSGYIEYEELDNSSLELSQASTIKRKRSYDRHPNIRSWMKRNYLGSTYHRVSTTRFFFYLHCYFKQKLEKYIVNN